MLIEETLNDKQREFLRAELAKEHSDKATWTTVVYAINCTLLRIPIKLWTILDLAVELQLVPAPALMRILDEKVVALIWFAKPDTAKNLQEAQSQKKRKVEQAVMFGLRILIEREKSK